MFMCAPRPMAPARITASELLPNYVSRGDEIMHPKGRGRSLAIGVLRLRGCFAKRSSYFAQDAEQMAALDGAGRTSHHQVGRD